MSNGSFATVAGGRNNGAGSYAFIGGGSDNVATANTSVIAGGFDNTASGTTSAVLGGESNRASGQFSVVAGGNGNSAVGIASFIAGGARNTAGDTSFAAGNGANASASGCVVFNNGTPSALTCGDNQFLAGAIGGFYFYSSAAGAGVTLAAGTGAWATLSDRNAKAHINPVDSQTVLTRLAAMPVSTWQWNSEPGAIQHMGPMAQDFYAAFGLGADDKHITTVDEEGVALAAIQGLNAKVEARDAIIADQAHELAELSAQLAAVASQLQRVEARLR